MKFWNVALTAACLLASGVNAQDPSQDRSILPGEPNAQVAGMNALPDALPKTVITREKDGVIEILESKQVLEGSEEQLGKLSDKDFEVIGKIDALGQIALRKQLPLGEIDDVQGVNSFYYLWFGWRYSYYYPIYGWGGNRYYYNNYWWASWGGYNYRFYRWRRWYW